MIDGPGLCVHPGGGDGASAWPRLPREDAELLAELLQAMASGVWAYSASDGWYRAADPTGGRTPEEAGWSRVGRWGVECQALWAELFRDEGDGPHILRVWTADEVAAEVLLPDPPALLAVLPRVLEMVDRSDRLEDAEDAEDARRLKAACKRGARRCRT
jgi:hypothetical protein